MVRWARARELLSDEFGTGELLGELQKFRDRKNDPCYRWRESLPTAIWHFLQIPDKHVLRRQFFASYRPLNVYTGYKQRWTPWPADPATAPKRLGVKVQTDP
jgi:hypothetical protein